MHMGTIDSKAGGVLSMWLRKKPDPDDEEGNSISYFIRSYENGHISAAPMVQRDSHPLPEFEGADSEFFEQFESVGVVILGPEPE